MAKKKTSTKKTSYIAVAETWGGRRMFLTDDATWSRFRSDANSFSDEDDAWDAIEDAIDDNRFVDSTVEEAK